MYKISKCLPKDPLDLIGVDGIDKVRQKIEKNNDL